MEGAEAEGKRDQTEIWRTSSRISGHWINGFVEIEQEWSFTASDELRGKTKAREVGETLDGGTS